MVLKIIYTLSKIKHICNLRKTTHKPKIAKELALPTQTKIVFKHSPTLKNYKYTDKQPDIHSRQNETEPQN